MDKYAKLVQVLRQGINPETPLPLMTAKVVEVGEETCKVEIGDLQLTDVRLKASINGADNKIIIRPKKDTFVLIGSLTGDFKDLCVLKVDEIESVCYLQDGLEVEIDSTDGKVSVKNDEVSLYGLLQNLHDIILNLKVSTPSGPSTGLLPDSVNALTQFASDFKQLLK